MNEDAKAFIHAPGSSDLISRDALSPALQNTLDHIIGQLTLISRTLVTFDQRLSLTENRMSALAAASRGLHATVPREVYAPPGPEDPKVRFDPSSGADNTQDDEEEKDYDDDEDYEN